MEEGTAASTPTPSTTSSFSLRIITLDYYMARPIPELDACYSSLLGQPIAEVPVVRIFGTTLTGQKTCVHVHKVFPYFYVPYDEDLPQDVTNALAFVRSLASAIEKALKLASNVGAKRQHVYSCSLVRGKKFYGFHAHEQLFVKIVLYYPQEVPRLSGLLLGGGILNRRFQPYESHIPFLLQVMVDHNLAGMGHLHLSDIRFRPPVLENQFVRICTSKSNLKSVVSLLAKHMAPSESVTAEKQFLTGSFMELWCRKVDKGEEAQNVLPDKQSTCELEGDTYVEAILNQRELLYVPLERAAPEVKMVQSLIPIWDELNVTRSMDAIGKGRNVPTQGYEQVARYEKDFQNMLERFLEVPEGPTMNTDADELSMANVQEDLSFSEGDSAFKSNTLLLCTQAAHSKNSFSRTHHNENDSRPLSTGLREKEEKEICLLNEDIIRHQLTQSSQDTDEEAVELLKWMISSQNDDLPTGYISDFEKVDDETSWSQAFQCADEALAKVISDYELCSQQECQAILDCLEEGAEAGQIGECDGSGHHIPQFDGSCDEETHDSKLMKAKLEGHNTLLGEEREDSKADQASLNMDPSVCWGRYQRKGWGPLSAKRSSQHLNLNTEQKPVVGVLKSHKEDVARTLDKELKEETETAFRLPEHSVRDLMRSKRIRKQPTPHTTAAEGSALVITDNLDKSATVINRGCVEDGRHYAALVCSPSCLEKKPERLEHSSRFGPLPLVKSGLPANSSRGFVTDEEEFRTEECHSALSELGTKECSSSSKINLSLLQGSEMRCSADDAERDACTMARQAGSEISNFIGRKTTKGGIETCFGSSMQGPELTPFILTFWKKPPTAEHLLTTFKSYSLPSVDHGEVFYGKAEDLPNKPTVMAGMLFKVRSQDVDHLSPYQFSNDVRGGFLTRSYGSANVWTPSGEDDSAVLPSHFHNDGTVLFLLSPVKLPPTVADVCAWIGQRQLGKDDFQQIEMVCEKISNFAEDSHDESQPSQLFRPSSPKYDETFMLPFSADEVTRNMALESDCRSFKQTTVELGSAEPSSKTKPGTGTGLSKGSVSKRESYGGALAWEHGSRGDVSQISDPTVAENHFTPISQAGFKDPASIGRGQQISVLSVEAFASTRGDLRPDPRYDSIKCIMMILQEDINDSQLPAITLLCDEADEGLIRNRDALINCEVVTMKDEASLLRMFVWFVRMYDPDILVGWEIQGFSLGLLAERAANLGLGLLREISRMPTSRTFSHGSEDKETESNQFGNFKDGRVVEPSIIDDEWGRTHGSGIHVGGRIVLNLWRIMRGEIKLGIYTLEAVAEAVLKRKIPSISWRTLTQWFLSGSGRKRHLCIEYCLNRTRLNLEIMDQLDLVNRTSELARVFGIDFFSVLSRGSQYRVESMMLRVAHSQNYLLISPSRQQVAAQPAMQCLPLVMEPESRFYTDPVVVLDFQSLYPSMMIAYNLCFSTCLGKVVPDNPKVLGVTSLNLDPKSLKDLKDCLTFTPNGVMFVSAKTRPGVLPRLLDEILSTRIMVKQSMKKLLPSQKVLERVLNARQLALKLISNVTYGYTAAGFSGRMPCAELADSIVQSGRYTLECAINFVNTNAKWNARVIYGDTDSMFVLLKGRSRFEAFKIGVEIAEAITQLNPHPVTLKMEKVYHPCVLLTKKRYVGYSYESATQVTPKFDAKGIETVRRDSCGAVAKTLEKSLRILFETHDISQVKVYLQRQWGKIMRGRISLKDFIFAKEVRLGSYSARASVLPPAAIVATKAMSIDPRAEPRYGERVPYLVVHGEPGARLVDMVVDPYVLVSTSSAFRLHDIYYINKQIIPALQRVFGLIGVDLSAWYNDLPRVFRPPSTKRSVPMFAFSRYSKHLNIGAQLDGVQMKPMSTRTIDHYYLSQHCLVCGDLIQASCFVCENCSTNIEVVGMSLLGRSVCLERRFKHLLAICRHCGGGDEKDMEEGFGCSSLACSVFYERIKVQKECRAAVAATNQCGFMWPQ